MEKKDGHSSATAKFEDMYVDCECFVTSRSFDFEASWEGIRSSHVGNVLAINVLYRKAF